MIRTAIDTNIIVGAISAWQDNHRRALTALEAVVRAPGAIVPIAALIEAYSVLTRMPSRYRLAPDVALQLLRETLENCEVVHLPSEAAWTFLAEMVHGQVVGGLIYDAVILESARLAGATRLLTFNNRHFELLPHEGIEIVVPA